MVRKQYDVRAVLRRFGIEVTWEDGTRLWAKCPFHLRMLGKEDEGATNWFIRCGGPRNGQSHCFACGGGGSLPWLVEHVLNLTQWSSAVEWLDEFKAEDEPLPRGVQLRVEARSLGREAFAMPFGVAGDEPLSEWIEIARDYVTKDRGLTPEQVRRWSIGYAVEGRLEGRIVVPVHDADDELCGYMARAYGSARKRYLYPSTAEHPNLDAMFGERHWPRSRERVYACEGAFNALAVERAIPGAHVAVLGGSHLRPMHAAKLSTFGEVVLLTDPDAAGDKAARALQAALGRHARVTRVRLPEGKDANDLSPEELRRCVAASETDRDSRRAT